MYSAEQNLSALADIRKIMERSSRFISLSGWSGIAAGVTALIGSWLGARRIDHYYDNYDAETSCPSCLKQDLMLIAGVVFITALTLAVLFTFLKSKKDGTAIWGSTARRLLWNTAIPMLAGALVIWRMMDLKQYDLIAAVSLVFYGLALVNGSKYTVGMVRYLGYALLLTGFVGLWLPKAGIILWAFGFGFLHIFYGAAMWWIYERREEA